MRAEYAAPARLWACAVSSFFLPMDPEPNETFVEGHKANSRQILFFQQLLIYNIKAQYTSVEKEFPDYRAQTSKSYC